MKPVTPSTSAPRDSVLHVSWWGSTGDAVTPELPSIWPAAWPVSRFTRAISAASRNCVNSPPLYVAAAGRAVLIGIDQEGGTRFALREPFTPWPSAADLGRLNDPQVAEQVARAMAVELRAVGCNLNFAPMLDLHVNAQSPVTTDRSFGGDPQQVAGMGVAFDCGLRARRRAFLRQAFSRAWRRGRRSPFRLARLFGNDGAPANR